MTIFGPAGRFSLPWQRTAGVRPPLPRVPVPIRPLSVQPGMQSVLATVPKTLASCEEFGCEWYLFGREGESEGKPFKHPQGVECGDFDRCPDPNCPCPDRVLLWPNQDEHGRRVRQGHVMPSRDPELATYAHAAAGMTRKVGLDEAWYRVQEGADALRHLLTRGL